MSTKAKTGLWCTSMTFKPPCSPLSRRSDWTNWKKRRPICQLLRVVVTISKNAVRNFRLLLEVNMSKLDEMEHLFMGYREQADVLWSEVSDEVYTVEEYHKALAQLTSVYAQDALRITLFIPDTAATATEESK